VRQEFDQLAYRYATTRDAFVTVREFFEQESAEEAEETNHKSDLHRRTEIRKSCFNNCLCSWIPENSAVFLQFCKSSKGCAIASSSLQPLLPPVEWLFRHAALYYASK
jgi:hypothetical protein